jgi:hypothetical protein
LRTGEPQNEAKQGGDLFGALCTDPERLEGLLRAMAFMPLIGPRSSNREQASHAQPPAASREWRLVVTAWDNRLREGVRKELHNANVGRTVPSLGGNPE